MLVSHTVKTPSRLDTNSAETESLEGVFSVHHGSSYVQTLLFLWFLWWYTEFRGLGIQLLPCNLTLITGSFPYVRKQYHWEEVTLAG